MRLPKMATASAPVVVDFRSLVSTTAWFFKPYFDTPNTTGVASDDLSKPTEMYANISGAGRAGLQVAIHAIGDRANNTILNFYERVEKENGSRDRRFRIEHAQHPVEIEKTRVEMTVFDGKVIYRRKGRLPTDAGL
jgi:predicted amidohydrolase YtcJ